MNNMFDIHTHALHGIDDGSESVEMSTEILRDLKKSGISRAYLTPHFDISNDADSRFFEQRELRYSELVSHPDYADIGIETKLGAEVSYFPSMYFMTDMQRLTLGESNFILLEFNLNLNGDIVSDIGRMISATGLQPIVAHAERCMSLMSKRHLYALAKYDVCFQINARSITDPKSIFYKKATSLIKDGFCDFIASDVHNMTRRKSLWDKAEATFVSRFGQSYFDKVVSFSSKIEK